VHEQRGGREIMERETFRKRWRIGKRGDPEMRKKDEGGRDWRKFFVL